MRLPKRILKFFKAIRFVLHLPKKLSARIHEALDDWAEMAPYRIRLMSQSFGGMSATGLSSLKHNPGAPLGQNRYRDDFTRREMLIWQFIDFDRMMFGKNDPITARQWMSMGDLYWEHRRVGEARAFYGKGLKIFELACENTDERLISARRVMANCCRTLCVYDEAEVLLRQVAAGLEARIIDPEAPAGPVLKQKTRAELEVELIANLLALAETLKKQTKFRESADVFGRLVDIHEANGLPNGEECLAVYRELSSAYSAFSDSENAELFSATARQLDFMRIVEKAVGPESWTLIRELEPLVVLYGKRNKTEIVASLKQRIEICQLVARVSGPSYPGIEKDLERLASHYDERNEPGDATSSFRLRARAKRIMNELGSKVTACWLMAVSKAAWLLEAIEGSEVVIATMLMRFC